MAFAGTGSGLAERHREKGFYAGVGVDGDTLFLAPAQPYRDTLETEKPGQNRHASFKFNSITN